MTSSFVIVGGGLTGAAAAIHLLRTIPQPFDLMIIDPDARLGRGLAYGKAEPFHILNVRAGRLGILAEQPGDFAIWAQAHSFGVRPPREAADLSKLFLGRRLFGDYVEARLLAEAAARPDVRFMHRRAHARAVRRGSNGYQIALDGRPPLAADHLILATGYGRGTEAKFGRAPFTALDPAEARSAKSALFVGTGMTFVDEFLRLRSLGFRGEALAISRHGLLPEVHRANEAPYGVDERGLDPGLRALLGSFRSEMRGSELPALAAVNVALGMREQLQPLWQSLGLHEQRRFLRHLRSYWTVVRHRLPPEAYAQLRHAMQSHVLRIAAARVADRSGDTVRLLARGEQPVEHRFDLVFDCTGHRPEINSPLILSLIQQGLARPDPHNLGLSVEPDGAVVGRSGQRSPGLYALGPLGHGTLFEITAIPEIVRQCAEMAKGLQSDFLGVSASGRAPAELGWARAG